MKIYFSERLQQLQERAEQDPLSFRRAALEAFRAYGLPRRKQDPWKYVNNSALLNLNIKQELESQPGPTAHTTGPAPPLAPADGGAAPNQSWSDIAFYNDQLCHQATPLALPGQWTLHSLELETLEREAQTWGLDRESLEAEENGYSLINAFSLQRAYLLQVEQNINSAGGTPCLRLRFGGEASCQFPRLYLRIPAGVALDVLIDSRNLGPEVYWNPYLHFDIGQGAQVRILERGPQLRPEADGSPTHVRSVSLRGNIAAAARVELGLFYWDTALAVHDARLAIRGEGAELSMRSICFAEGNSAYHLRTESQHLAPRSKSNCLYKNILFDKAISEFYGIIHASNDAVGTDAGQKNCNLLLSERARAIARPQLEILIDDLKCSHGSATGNIDEDALFYMRSRGLSREQGMQLAITGFVEEISISFPDELLEALEIEDCLQALLTKRNRL